MSRSPDPPRGAAPQKPSPDVRTGAFPPQRVRRTRVEPAARASRAPGPPTGEPADLPVAAWAEVVSRRSRTTRSLRCSNPEIRQRTTSHPPRGGQSFRGGRVQPIAPATVRSSLPPPPAPRTTSVLGPAGSRVFTPPTSPSHHHALPRHGARSFHGSLVPFEAPFTPLRPPLARRTGSRFRLRRPMVNHRSCPDPSVRCWGSRSACADCGPPWGF